MKITTQPVSLRPSDMVDDDVDPLVVALAEYENNAKREDTFGIARFPIYTRRALDIFRRRLPGHPKNLQDTTAFAIAHGVELILHLPGHTSLCDSRDRVLKVGADEISFFESWSYAVNLHHEPGIRLWTRVEEAITAKCNRFASEVGVKPYTVATLAVMATLIHVEGLPDHQKRQMREELVTFGEKLRDRADLGRQLAERVQPASTSMVATFEEVLELVNRARPPRRPA